MRGLRGVIRLRAGASAAVKKHYGGTSRRDKEWRMDANPEAGAWFFDNLISLFVRGPWKRLAGTAEPYLQLDAL